MPLGGGEEMSTAILALVFLALITAATVYSLKTRSKCSSCRHCQFEDQTDGKNQPSCKCDNEKSDSSDKLNH